MGIPNCFTSPFSHLQVGVVPLKGLKLKPKPKPNQ